MSLKIIRKDITTVNDTPGIILHICNNRGMMGAGVAKALYTKWPRVKTEYLAMEKYELGDIGWVNDLEVPDDCFGPDLGVGNMIAQDGYGHDDKQYLSYDALAECLGYAQRFNEGWYDGPIYVPYNMGCGLAGGDWSFVMGMMDTYIPDAIICQLP